MPVRQASTTKRTVRETAFLIANTALSFLRLIDGGQIKSISCIYFQDTAVTDGERSGKISMGDRQAKQHYVGIVQEEKMILA